MLDRFKLLETDFYQIRMALGYICLGQANQKVGFEAFYRHPKPKVCAAKNYYIFGAEENVKEFIEEIRQELSNPETTNRICETLWNFISPTLKDNKEEVRELFEKNIKSLNTEFEYHVAKHYSIIPPYVPVFQYKGPKWIGQLIETAILYLINSPTGFFTWANSEWHQEDEIWEERNLIEKSDFDYTEFINEYLTKVTNQAKRYRKATSKVLLDGSLRRAPLMMGDLISKIAIENGINGTSNVKAYYTMGIDQEKIDGTMAHSWVMSHSSELEAYKNWNYLFPNSTILIDTYDVERAVWILIDNKIKPSDVRIDCEPLELHIVKVREILDLAGWKDVGIYVSGDLTPERLIEFERERYPYTKAMIGTKLANVGKAEYINAGFVYKLVECEINGNMVYPEKKYSNKTNYSGLKKFYFNSRENELYIHTKNSESGLEGLDVLEQINENAKITFIEGRK